MLAHTRKTCYIGNRAPFPVEFQLQRVLGKTTMVLHL